MNFDELLKNNKIEKVEKSDFDISLAEKDLDFAKKGIETGNYDRGMAVIYEAVLRAGNKLMNFYGFRAIGKEHHKNTFEFLKIVSFDKEIIEYFDNIRKKGIILFIVMLLIFLRKRF